MSVYELFSVKMSQSCNISSTCFLKHFLTALNNNDYKTSLIIYDDLLSTLSGHTHSADRGKGLNINRNFGAEDYVLSYVMNKKAGISIRYHKAVFMVKFS